ncbi:methyltransferase-like protein 23 isoform X2 [Limulus polyphemus]|uniref:Methyltransferase-like protein 23 isoform X2 n=1 Tax=Limulus polyphemus TaxID=6850 RepID=A0ABM1SEQ3_LIMPO|nr:methyltransferase-like protein 23 isoform X2 [Limulus polyphemus]
MSVTDAENSLKTVLKRFYFQDYVVNGKDFFTSLEEESAVTTSTSRNKSRNLKIKIKEVLHPCYGLYVWPSAPVLAQYVWYNREMLTGKVVLEVGAGVALPGIVAAKVGAEVFLSDTEFLPQCLEHVSENISLNNLDSSKITIIAITWGFFSSQLLSLKPVDVILGSDCFYDTKVVFLLKQNPIAQFWCAYQERSSDWTIEHLLTKWSLSCEEVPLANFDADSAEIGGSTMPGCHTVHLLVIKLKEFPSVLTTCVKCTEMT